MMHWRDSGRDWLLLIAAAGWMLVAIPFTLLFLMAYIRLYPLAF